DTNELLDEVIDELDAEIAATKAEVVRANLEAINCEPEQFKLVVQNLILNGIKYQGQDRPRIVVSSRANAEFVEIKITDNGRGISPGSDIDLFKSENRGDDVRSQVDGAGLGLAI